MKSICNNQIEKIWFGLISSCETASTSLCMRIQSDKDRRVASQKLMPGIASIGLYMGIWSKKDYENLIWERSEKFDLVKIMKIWSDKDHCMVLVRPIPKRKRLRNLWLW